MHLLGPLRRDEQVEAELPPLGRDPDCVLRDESRDGIVWLLGAHVMRLVDHDQHGLAVGAPPPECFEHRLRGDRLLLAGRQRAEVDDETARVAALDVVDERPRPAARPQLPVRNAEVLGP